MGTENLLRCQRYVNESDRTLESVLLEPTMCEIHDCIAQIGSCMKRNGAWDSKCFELSIPITQWKAGAVRDRSLRNEGTEKIPSSLGHACNVQCDCLKLDSACSWVLPQMQNGIVLIGEIFVESFLKQPKIHWVTTRGQARNRPSMMQKCNQGFPTGVLIPNVVWLKGGKQDSQGDLSVNKVPANVIPVLVQKNVPASFASATTLELPPLMR